MKLTEIQIKELYKFTRQHYVEHYDVQTELVDHLANDIERIWKQEPNLSFREARDKSFKKFGIFGFMEVVETKQKQLQKKYWKILWSFVKQWFKLPKIILTVGFTFLTYKVLQTPFAVYVVWVIFLATNIFGFYRFIKIRKHLKKKTKKWMFEEILLLQSNSFILVFAQYPIHILNFKSNYTANYTTLLMGLIIVLISITLFISLEIIPKKTEEYLKKHYPEYNISKTL